MKALLVALALCGSAQAAMISGQVTGVTTYAPQPEIPAGLPFRFEFSLNTELPASQPYADEFGFFFELYVGDKTFLDQIPGLAILPGQATPYTHDYFGTIAADTLGVQYVLGADDLFHVAFTVPGAFTDPEYPLMDLTLESITGVSINFVKYGQTPVVSWFAINSPIDVPEPKTSLLLLIGGLLLIYFGRKLL